MFTRESLNKLIWRPATTGQVISADNQSKLVMWHQFIGNENMSPDISSVMNSLKTIKEKLCIIFFGTIWALKIQQI